MQALAKSIPWFQEIYRMSVLMLYIGLFRVVIEVCVDVVQGRSKISNRKRSDEKRNDCWRTQGIRYCSGETHFVDVVLSSDYYLCNWLSLCNWRLELFSSWRYEVILNSYCNRCVTVELHCIVVHTTAMWQLTVELHRCTTCTYNERNILLEFVIPEIS